MFTARIKADILLTTVVDRPVNKQLALAYYLIIYAFLVATALRTSALLIMSYKGFGMVLKLCQKALSYGTNLPK